MSTSLCRLRSTDEVAGTALTAPEPPAVGTTAPGGSRARVTGVDVARGVALMGMMATHIFEAVTKNGPTATGLIASGRSAATFVMVAGVGVAFLTGGQHILCGRPRAAAAVGLAVRALMIGAIGFLMDLSGSDIDIILPYYAVMFLLAIPLLRLRTKALASISAAVIALGPVILIATARLNLPDSGTSAPTFATLVTEPGPLLVQLFVTGDYPVLVYMAYLCAGLAIGRLDLTSRRVAGWLLGGGIAMTVVSRVVSDVLLYRLGGLDRLLEEGKLAGDLTGDRAADLMTALWEPPDWTWWHLASVAPHQHTNLDLVHSLGSAMALLGASLLLTRIPAFDRLLSPLRAAGAMTLTIYCGHIFVLASGVLEDWQTVLYLLLVVSSMVFAVLWRRSHSQGPLEQLVATLSGRVRRAVLAP